MSEQLTLAWGLVQWARCSGAFADDFAMAALIDAEVELEGLLDDAATGSVVVPTDLDGVTAARWALEVVAAEPAVPAVVHGWLRSALETAAS